MTNSPIFAGKYQISRELGQGRYATVYRAFDTVLQRDVALKIFAAEVAASPDFNANLERLVSAAARIHHPHIVPIHAVGEHGGRSFIAMGLAEGGTLGHIWAKRGSLPIDLVIDLLTGLGQGIDVVHRQGLLHLNIQPGNVLFRRPGIWRGGEVLTDLGLTGATIPGFGHNGIYSAPEITGEGELYESADIYSLGMLGTAMLAGRHPTHRDELGQVLASSHPIYPVLARAQALDPRDRFATTTDFIQALRTAHIIMVKEVGKTIGVPPGYRQESGQETLKASLPEPAGGSDRDQPVHAPTHSPKWRRWMGVGLASVLLATIVLAGASPIWGSNAGNTKALGSLLTAKLVEKMAAPNLMVTPALRPVMVSETEAMSPPSSTATPSPTSTPAPTMVANRPAESATSSAMATLSIPQPRVDVSATQPAMQRPEQVGAGELEPGIETVDIHKVMLGGVQETGKRQPRAQAVMGFASGNEQEEAWAKQLAVSYTPVTPQPTVDVRPIPTATPSLSGHLLFPLGQPDGSSHVAVLDVAKGLVTTLYEDAHQADIRPDGKVVMKGVGGDFEHLFTMPVTGGLAHVVGSRIEDAYPHWSPTGSSSVFQSTFAADQEPQIYVQWDMERVQKAQLLTVKNMPLYGRFPTWLGNWRVAFSGCAFWDQVGQCGIWTVATDGNDIPSRLTDTADDRSTDSYGGTLIYDSGRGGNRDVYAVPHEGGPSVNLSQHPAQDLGATFSPDGRYIAFMSDREGGWGIWVMRRDGSGVRRLLAVPSGFGTTILEERLAWGE